MSDSKTLQKTGGDGLPARPSIEGVEDALLDGDLSKLNPQQRVSYMERVCESVGLNPLTKPFRYIRLNGELTLYATRDAAEQLRKVHGISITSLDETWREDLCIFRAYAKDADGRTDVATGAVDTSRSSGQGLANDIMKAETKAKRRVTLSLAGLGWLDETEISDIPDSATEEVTVDYETGEELHEWQAPTNETFELSPGKIGSLNAAAEALEHENGADLAAKIEATRNGWNWDGEAGDALEALLTFHEKRLEDAPPSGEGLERDTEDYAKAEEQEARYGGSQDALKSIFDEAWADGKEGWEAISEAQLNRLYAIADDNDWDEASLNRLVKDELGWDSKEDIPYGDPYDEICEALEDERLRYHMSRDPDTPDMFEGQAEESVAESSNAAEFEEGTDDDDLPF